MKRVAYKHIAITIALTIIIITLTSVILIKNKTPKPTYITTQVYRGDIENSVLAIGHLDAKERVNVGAQVSGQVKSILVHTGEYIKKGQKVAIIDDIPQRNDLKIAEAALDVLNSNLDIKKLQIKQAGNRYLRQKKMLLSDATSREDYEEAKSALETSQAELKSLKSQMIQAKIEVKNKELALSYTQVQAPIDGVVVTIVTQQGQTVNSSQNAPTIIKMARLDIMTIKAKISETDVTKIHEGQKAYFTIFSEEGKRYIARLRDIELAPESVMKDESSSAGSSSSSTAGDPVYYNALLDVPNPDNRLRIAMTTQVSLVLDEAKNALLIPLQAIHRDQKGKSFVRLLVKDNKVEEREVLTGTSNNASIQIIKGLKQGDRVILSHIKNV
ncbi:efflux RND transporter periplasmic adaptor subunit [Enterobacter chuandaensis]|uniref:efflux RND transporter periplasmic adaptor subunit n=1 Tax=Enterobacter chuandaensis TaxID=2497875 RepID=UPI00300C785D